MHTEAATVGASTRILTVPNGLTMIRLACVPLFVWLLFGRDTRLGAAALLAVLGGTDWVDGWVARRFDQASELGKVLDPTADRLLLVVAAIALAVDGSIPGLVFWPVVVREVLISAVVLVMAAMGAARIDVLWVGKAGAFGLMFALPLFLLAEAGTANDDLWRALAWICAVPGMIFSYYAAVQYAQRVPAALRAPGEDKGVTTR